MSKFAVIRCQFCGGGGKELGPNFSVLPANKQRKKVRFDRRFAPKDTHKEESCSPKRFVACKRCKIHNLGG